MSLDVEPRYDPDTSNLPLDAASRTSSPVQLFWFWVASGLTVAGVPSGVIIASAKGMTVFWSVAAVLIGLAISGIVLVAVSIAGVRTGQATLVLSKDVFGTRGNVVPLAISFLILMGWCAVMSVLVVYCVDAILQQFGVHIDDTVRLIVLAIFAVALIALVWLGYHLIQLTQKWIALAVGIACVLMGSYAALHTSWQAPLQEKASGFSPIVAGIVIALATSASGWWNAGADYSRFLPATTRRRPLATAIMAGMSGVMIAVLLGCLLYYWIPGLPQAENPVAEVTNKLPLPIAVAGLFVVMVGLHAAAVTNMYSASLNLNTFGLQRRPIAVAVSAALTIGIAAWVLFGSGGFYSWFSAFLTVLGVPLAAWAGVFIVPVVAGRGWPRLDTSVAWIPLAWLGAGSIVGLGLIKSSTPGTSWVGYLAPNSSFTAAGGGVLVAFVVGLAGAWVTRSLWQPAETEVA